MGTLPELQIIKKYVPKDCEKKTKSGDNLSMHYTGTIDKSSSKGETNKKFDSSLDRNSPFEFRLGTGQVIKGWDEGLLDMCIGEKRTLIIPPHLGYGEKGAGGQIPGGATLNFEVECIDILEAPEEHEEDNIFKEMDTDGDKKLSKEEVKTWFKDKYQEEIPNELWEQEDKDK